MKWDSGLYDQQHGFVAQYGLGLLDFVPLDDRQRILDLGCGTGTLTAQLAQRCASVLGVDASPAMIAKARQAYPALDFQVMDALALPFEDEWEVVFSNAVFHWIPDHDLLLENIRRALKPSGKLVCEFGAHANVAAIRRAFSNVLREFGASCRSAFNFPTDAAFSAKLQAHGFIVDKVYSFDRPTPLKGGEQGLGLWIRQFFAVDLEPFTDEEQDKIVDRLQSALQAKLWNGREWVADYRRLRAVAHVR